MNSKERFLSLVRDGYWRTLAEIGAATGHSEAGAGARLRELRTERFGAFVVERRRRSHQGRRDLWEYRLLDPQRQQRIRDALQALEA